MSKKDYIAFNTEKKYERWTIVGSMVKKGKHKYWPCRCNCGNEKLVYQGNLQRGLTGSCGCLNKELSAARQLKHGFARKDKTTNTYSSKIYGIWLGMRRRCVEVNSKSYPRYGGRGIKVCERWFNSFENFLQDMKEPEIIDGIRLTIERINNDGDYEPDNCRWATFFEQGHNKSNNVILTLDGKTQCVSLWAIELGCIPQLLHGRLRKGWSVEKTLRTPVGKGAHPITFQGRTLSMTHLAEEYGLDVKQLSRRLAQGWDLERALTLPLVDPGRYIEFEGCTRTITDWAKELGFPDHMLSTRLRRGWSVEECLTIPVGGKRKHK